MATLIERVGRQALYTFSKNTMTSAKFEENFEKLRVMADQLTAADINFDLDNLQLIGRKDRKSNPPVTYINIYEDRYVSIGIFVLKPGVKLPLHDHPHMFGILKVITGTVKVQSYTLVNSMPLTGKVLCVFGDNQSHRLSATKLPEVIVNEESGVCFLTPTERNLHEIYSVNGAAAFLDILAPPYDGDNGGDHTCHYFKEEKVKSAGESGMTTLVTIPSPPEYWNDNAVYEGPRIRFGNGELD